MIRGVLLDVGGVVAIGTKPIPGAVQAIKRLREQSLEVRFVTNITRQSHRDVVASLIGLGIAVSKEEVFTPSVAARAWLSRNSGIPYLLIHPDLREDFATFENGRPNTLVVGDAGTIFNYNTLNTAFRVLHGGGQFLALATNRVFRDSDGELSLDAGAFVAALEYASGTHAIVLGKPSAAFFHAAVTSMGCQPAEAVMVGDDAEFDVAAAISAGLRGLLVRTGKYTPGDENKHVPSPSKVVADISEAVDWVVSHYENQNPPRPKD
jgi:HAD superfamily hydrolase (TIGR01458 family)